MSAERTCITLQATAWRANLRAIHHLAPKASILPIIKANAYGHGLLEALQGLKNAPIWGFGVAYGEEAIAVRQAGWRGRVLVLSHWEPEELPTLERMKVDLIIDSFLSLQLVQKFHKKYHRWPRIHLKLDTGTTRVGFIPSDWEKVRQLIQKNTIPVAGVYSHLANSEAVSSVSTRAQQKLFLRGRSLWPKAVAHLACSAAIIRYPETHFDLVRPGLMLYGLWPSRAIRLWAKQHQPKLKLQPVLSWTTHLAAVKRIGRGTRVGYGSTYIVKKDTNLGILPVGYADGLDRRLSNCGFVAIAGRRYPIVGRISMNLTMVDLGHRSLPAETPVELIGQHVSFDDWEAWAGIFPYEAVSRLSPSIKRSIL